MRYGLGMIYTYSSNILIAVRRRSPLLLPHAALPAMRTRGAWRGAGLVLGTQAKLQCKSSHRAEGTHNPTVHKTAQVNPHKRLRHLYGSRMRAQYRGKTLGELSPHVYAIAEQVCMSFIRGTTNLQGRAFAGHPTPWL